MSNKVEGLPGTLQVRRRIENVGNRSSRNALKFAWLGLCRVSEVVGKASRSDVGTTARGPTGEDVQYTEYVDGELRHPVVLFRIKTSKRSGLERLAAYPLDVSYEPWAVEISNYFKEFSPSQNVFDFTRQKLWKIARDAFDGLTYPIEEYHRVIEEHELKEGMQIIKDRGDELIIKQKKHRRAAGTHAIRHIRVVDLMTIHGFSIQQISTIGGWTLRSVTGASTALSRYAHLDWRSYYTNMLIKRGFKQYRRGR